MKSLGSQYEKIGNREIGYSTASIIVGVAILTLPKLLAETIHTSDGWIAITIAGLMTILFVLVVTKLAASFPRQTFVEYSAAITIRPVAIVLTILYFVYFVVFVAYELRSIIEISSIYLFDQTPREAIALVFLLTVIYAVSGSRIALIRLNMLFFPVVIVVALLVQLISISFFDYKNLLPMFVTDWSGLWAGITKCSFSFFGFEVLLFYIAYMDQPKSASKAAVSGIAVATSLYLVVYIFCIGILGREGAANVNLPTIEITKSIMIPGQFFERIESIFLTIWIMTVFNTTTMAYDTAVMALRSVFTHLKKRSLVFMIAPLTFISAMWPRDALEFQMYGQWFSFGGIFLAVIVPTSLYVIMKIRRLGHGK